MCIGVANHPFFYKDEPYNRSTPIVPQKATSANNNSSSNPSEPSTVISQLTIEYSPTQAPSPTLPSSSVHYLTYWKI